MLINFKKRLINRYKNKNFKLIINIIKIINLILKRLI